MMNYGKQICSVDTCERSLCMQTNSCHYSHYRPHESLIGCALLTPEMRGALGVRMAARRKSLNLSQAELAKRAGLKPGAIGNYEAGTRKSPRNLLQIADALEVPAHWLMFGDEKKAEVTQIDIRHSLGNPDAASRAIMQRAATRPPGPPPPVVHVHLDLSTIDELQGLIRDAERYRWIREHTSVGYSMPGSPYEIRLPRVQCTPSFKGSVRDELDAAIDAAMKAMP